MSAFNHYYGITEQEVPEEIENDEPDIQTCSCCNSPVVDFVEKHFYIICNECLNEHPGKTLNEIVEMIKFRNKKLTK